MMKIKEWCVNMKVCALTTRKCVIPISNISVAMYLQVFVDALSGEAENNLEAAAETEME